MATLGRDLPSCEGRGESVELYPLHRRAFDQLCCTAEEITVRTGRTRRPLPLPSRPCKPRSAKSPRRSSSATGSRKSFEYSKPRLPCYNWREAALPFFFL